MTVYGEFKIQMSFEDIVVRHDCYNQMLKYGFVWSDSSIYFDYTCM